MKKQSLMKKPLKQNFFDQVCFHLLTQGRKSLQGTSCRLRGDDGLKSGIGCLISDRYYSSALETAPIYSYSVLDAVAKSHALSVTDLDPLFLGRLQRVHDQWEPSHWVAGLKKLADAEGLILHDYGPHQTPPLEVVWGQP